MAKRRLARLAVLTAATTLLPLGTVPGIAVADVPANALVGHVYLPNGEAAQAAIIDIRLVYVDGTPLGEPITRGVSSEDGSYHITIPNDGVLLRTLDGDDQATIHLQAEVTDLVASSGPGQTPDAFRAVEETVATIERTVDSAGNEVANIHVTQFEGGGTIIAKVSELAAAAGIFTDPDMLTGHEDLTDPALIPPPGGTYEMFSLTESDALPLPETGFTEVDGLLGPQTSGQEHTSSSCEWNRIYRWGGKNKLPGVDTGVYVYINHCTNENNADKDYWGVSYWGWIEPTYTDATEWVGIWRFKFRNEGTGPNYKLADSDPKRDDKYGGDVGWSVGIGSGGPNASISGTFEQDEQGWMHPWPRDTNFKVYHVSFLADDRPDLYPGTQDPYKRGAAYGVLDNGGGTIFEVPKGTTVDQFVAGVKRDIWIMRCWWKKGAKKVSCDPSR